MKSPWLPNRIRQVWSSDVMIKWYNWNCENSNVSWLRNLLGAFAALDFRRKWLFQRFF